MECILKERSGLKRAPGFGLESGKKLFQNWTWIESNSLGIGMENGTESFFFFCSISIWIHALKMRKFNILNRFIFWDMLVTMRFWSNSRLVRVQKYSQFYPELQLECLKMCHLTGRQLVREWVGKSCLEIHYNNEINNKHCHKTGKQVY